MDTQNAFAIISSSAEVDYNTYAAAVRTVVKELKRYQKIGTVEEFQRLKTKENHKI